MKKAVLFNFLVEKEEKRIRVERSFDAPADLVWAAWTEADILDLWWAPKPFITVTQSLNFTEGGQWHYCMQGPDGERHWCMFNYEKINPMKYFSGKDGFCDENAVPDHSMPMIRWANTFEPQGDQTIVDIQLDFDQLEDLETIIKMGFREGFTAGLENLDQYIAAQFYLRKQNKPDNSPRTSSYLNFPGNAEEAFRFYRAIFRTDFVNGIQRFGEIPAESGHPPIAENVKKMVLHIELPLPGGHVLMGTDSPREMGFNVIPGNNMHINIEPESKEEADRIFNALSESGSITMPIQEMFWGAYFGSFSDKFGINWMVNYQPR